MNTIIELFVPGRVCLFGEHSDWAGSYLRLYAPWGGYLRHLKRNRNDLKFYS